MQRINRTIAVWLTSAVGTMWCAYLFFVLAVLGFPPSGSAPSAYVQWISQTCIQLVMLSVIMVGQQVMDARHADRHEEQMEHHTSHAARLDGIEAHLKHQEARAMSLLPAFPLLNQLRESDSNRAWDCVPESIAAGINYLLGTQDTGTDIKDAVYGAGYQGAQSAQAYVPYCAALGITLAPYNGSQQALVDRIHQEIEAGHPCVVTMPSQWAYAPADPVHPTGSTHVGIACGTFPGGIRVMNPWGGFWQDQSDAWWAARLCYGQIWIMAKEATVATIPNGWQDDGTTIIAPNGVQITAGFADYLRMHPAFWGAAGLPMGPPSAVAMVGMDPAHGAGSELICQFAGLGWTEREGVYPLWVGAMLWALRQQSPSVSPADQQKIAFADQVFSLVAQTGKAPL